MSYIITFINEKGGVGKSSVCFSTAWKLANIGQKVLLIDLDGQKANISFSPEFTKTVILLMADIFKNNININSAIINVKEKLRIF